MKMTLLQMVQAILSSMDSDEVNSITDTTESLQVAQFLQDSYFEIMAGLNPPANKTLFSLVSPNSSATPTLMSMPANANTLEWVTYDTHTTEDTNPNYTPVYFKDPERFARDMFTIGSDTPDLTLNDTFSYNITNVNGDVIKIFGRNDRGPKHYTSFDDVNIIFDSYDSKIESYLQPSKTTCWGELTQTWTNVDSFVPNLNDYQFSLLLNEAKNQAFVESKQSSNPIAAQRAMKGWSRARREKQRVPNYQAAKAKTKTDFGRRTNPSPILGTYRDHEQS